MCQCFHCVYDRKYEEKMQSALSKAHAEINSLKEENDTLLEVLDDVMCRHDLEFGGGKGMER